SATRQGGQPFQLDGADDLVGDEDVRDTRIDQCLGLVQLGTEEAVRSARGDVLCQAGAFQRLEMDACLDAVLVAGIEEALEVGIDAIEIDEQLRRIEHGERLSNGGSHEHGPGEIAKRVISTVYARARRFASGARSALPFFENFAIVPAEVLE